MMTGKWHVMSRLKNQDAGPMKDYGNFASKEDANNFLPAVQREHPDLHCWIEECAHPEHQQG